MHEFFKKHKTLCVIVILITIAGTLALFRNLSHEDLIRKLQNSGSHIRPVLGEELKIKREYFASHTSFAFLILSKAIASPTIKRETYKKLLSGDSMDEATKEAVDKMPPEEVGLVLEVDSVPVEFTRFGFEHLPRAITAMQTELLKKDHIHAQCDKPEYEKRMTCSKIVYIPKRNYLITASNIRRLIEIKDNSGNLVARDYEAIPEEEFQKVIQQLQRL